MRHLSSSATGLLSYFIRHKTLANLLLVDSVFSVRCPTFIFCQHGLGLFLPAGVRLEHDIVVDELRSYRVEVVLWLLEFAFENLDLCSDI